MGIYMSAACKDVEIEEGFGNGVKYAVGEMQGWRKSMEDAHITFSTLNDQIGHNVNIPMSLFGVFDGHGGKEVAKFAKMKFAEVLVQELATQGNDIEAALKESFHKIDVLLEDRQFDSLLREFRAIPNPSDVKLSPNTVRDDLESPPPEGSKKTLSTQQAVDLIRNLLLAAKLPQSYNNPFSDEDDEILEEISATDTEIQSEEMEKEEAAEVAHTNVIGGWESGDMDVDDDIAGKQAVTSELVDEEDIVVVSTEECNSNSDSSSEDSKNNSGESRAVAVVEMEEEDEDAAAQPVNSSGSRAIPSPGKKNLSVIVSQDDSSLFTRSQRPWTSSNSNTEVSPTSTSEENKEVAEKRIVAAVSTPNGFQCAFPPHRVIAGCTAIVAFVIGKKLYVANAGDSRGVLCRENGISYALSDDHKPNGHTEFQRIRSAGGFVNAMGRVNGNLNLSRSLGDLKYKQLKHLPREDQVISADPDISVTDIESTDRFFLLACDGIWDCLTNQDACDFVSERLDRGMDLTQIVEEMCHHCVSEDPRASTGIGSDNMTCLIVMLNQ